VIKLRAADTSISLAIKYVNEADTEAFTTRDMPAMVDSG
jgi:hypothetical protein